MNAFAMIATKSLMCRIAVCLTVAVALVQPVSAAPDPNKNFLANFLQAKYLLPFPELPGEAFGGDLTATYDHAYMPVRPWAELLIIGEFPRARYFAITIYDDHGAIIDTLVDHELEPLLPGQLTPYRAGGPAGTEDILYAVRVQLGDNLAATPVPGCQLDGLNIDSNVLDGRFRHTAGTRYSADQTGFTVTDGDVTVVHDDSPQNSGISMMIRRYLEEEDGETGAFDLTTPLVFIRDVFTGCGVDMWNLIGQPQPVPPRYIYPSEWFNFDTTVDIEQVAAHIQNSKTMPIMQPDGLDPFNFASWYGGPEYILAANPDTGYLSTGIPQKAKPVNLNAEEKVMRLRFRLPQTPCASRSCELTGTEEMRYWGISFVEGERTVIKSISELDLNPDENGYVDLVISFGTPLPEWVTTDNGYSVIFMPESDIRLMTLRNIVSGPGFECTLDNVPFKTSEHHGNGGYLGEYAPFMTLPKAATLPPQAIPYIQGGSCAPP